MSELYESLMAAARMTGAATRLARVQAGRMAAEGSMTDDEVLSVSELFPVWRPGAYGLGEVCNHAGQTWQCVQAHDSTGNEGWAPGAAASLWGPYHATDAANARDWIQPTGAHDAYQKGEVMRWTDGKVYRCKQDATVHGPDAPAAAWEVLV